MSELLMFPNKAKVNEPQEEDVEPEDVKILEERETKKIMDRVELLEKEKRLEEERSRRIKRKVRKMNEASLRKAVKKRQAIAMRMRNIPIDKIAEKLNVSQGYASNLIREAVAEMPEETAEDLKKLLGRTVVQLIGNFEKTALQGGVREAEIMLKGITQLMRLAGLNIQHRQVEQTNMNVGEISSGIDVADLDLDLETKKKILNAMRKKQLQKPRQEELQKEDVYDGEELVDEENDTI